eukprot:TRINITY_DN6498_c0_g1_i6.p1 TRINITY_DN6498_c0_g1~~TRINITY_DN6498_c0_g1_i6.p1  ORF type:complete len:463 (-),score=84.06 TRINITY_DN6498_c0_g1_i6:131-1438(-)
MSPSATFLVLAGLVRLQLVGAEQPICDDHSCPQTHDEASYAASRDVMLLQALLTTEEDLHSALEDRINELASKLQPVANRSGRGDLQAIFTMEALSQLLSEAGRQPASTNGATSEVWARLTNVSRQIVSTLIADTVDDQAAIDKRRQAFNDCETLPEQNTTLIAKVEQAKNVETSVQQRQREASLGSVSYDFGDDVSSAESEANAKKELVELRMEQYTLILQELANVEANHRTSQSELRQANSGLVAVKNSCRCSNKDAFDQQVNDVQGRVGHRESEEKIAMLLNCIGEQTTLSQKMQCMSQNNWGSNIPAINNTEVQLPKGTACGTHTNAATATTVDTATTAAPSASPQDSWIERPLVADEGPGLPGSISPFTSVDACKQVCDNNPRCNSFALCEQGPSGCWMKERVISASDATTQNGHALNERRCRTWYKSTQ